MLGGLNPVPLLSLRGFGPKVNVVRAIGIFLNFRVLASIAWETRVGLKFGPFAGTIALGLQTVGLLGKLYAETMEEVPMRPIEAVRSLGARPLQVLFWAIWPQARPLLSSYTVLRREMNLRASTILGLVGGVAAWDRRFTTTCNSVSTHA